MGRIFVCVCVYVYVNNHHLVCHVSYTASPNQSLVRPLLPSSALVHQGRHVAPGAGCVYVCARYVSGSMYGSLLESPGGVLLI